jgi:hypothetical protein
MQIPDYSIGRVGPDARWALTQPTIGGMNVVQATGNTATLKINEWFTSQDVRPFDDFVELYNPASLPVPLGGLFITDDPGARPLRHAIAPLSFIAAGGFAALSADGNIAAGADHLGFSLTAEIGRIALFQGGPTLVGDFNDDGQVDTADYVRWRKSAGQIVPGGSGADANEDGLVNQTDHNLWRANYGRSTANPAVRTDAAVAYADVPGLRLIDFVTYMRQTVDYSQGRSPSGAATYQYFAPPTPGAANATAPSSANVAAMDVYFMEMEIQSQKRSRPLARPIVGATPEDDELLLAVIYAEGVTLQSPASAVAALAAERHAGKTMTDQLIEPQWDSTIFHNRRV